MDKKKTTKNFEAEKKHPASKSNAANNKSSSNKSK